MEDISICIGEGVYLHSEVLKLKASAVFYREER